MVSAVHLFISMFLLSTSTLACNVRYGTNCARCSSDKQKWTCEHNVRRRRFHHQFKKSFVPVVWDQKLANSAKSYAKFLARTCQLMHKEDGFKGGENLAMNYGPTSHPISNILYRFTEQEYKGIQQNPGQYMSIGKHGHFTQVVWRPTKRVGCGSATSTNKRCSIQVCRYQKAGNCNICPRSECRSYKEIPFKTWTSKTFADDSPC